MGVEPEDLIIKLQRKMVEGDMVMPESIPKPKGVSED